MYIKRHTAAAACGCSCMDFDPFRSKPLNSFPFNNNSDTGFRPVSAFYQVKSCFSNLEFLFGIPENLTNNL
jgi:hypothetical protein